MIKRALVLKSSERSKGLRKKVSSSGARKPPISPPTASTNPGADHPELEALHFSSNKGLARLILDHEAVKADPDTSAIVKGILGLAAGSDDHHSGSLLCQEDVARELPRRMDLTLTDPAVSVVHVEARLPGSRTTALYAAFPGISARDARELSKIADNAYWMPVPRIIDVSGTEMLDFVFEGILFGPNLDEEIESRLREPSFRLATAEQPQPLIATLLGRDQKAIRSKICGMAFVQRSHLPVGSDRQKRQGHAHRLLQVRAMSPVKQLKKLDRGEGRLHMLAALEASRAALPDRKAAGASAAPKDRRARDIHALMRATGYGDYDLPFIKY